MIAEALPIFTDTFIFLVVLVGAVEAVLLAPYVWIPVEALHVRRLFVG